MNNIRGYGTNQLLQQLFESTSVDSRYMYREMAESPLVPITSESLRSRYTNPFTNKPYEGMLLYGEFASIDTLNNNNRRYKGPNYIEYVELLRKECASAKGVYGEYEHPKGYAVDGKNLSHKVLDLWYDEKQKKVFGYVMILNTPDGLKAQEVIKSGGLLGISARGGGSETPNQDGTIDASLKLLVTFDLVYHPGFSTSLLGVRPELLFENEQGKFKEKEKSEDEKDQQKMQENEPTEKSKIQDNLGKSVDKKQTKLNENFAFTDSFINGLKNFN